ncbi:DMT family transporter [Aestuariivirga litoralis]|uniref:DMT family transporter n=1 Tax=Aestuariivirga litoralis TaxID=2650924 RepID=UPI0018C60DFF|nr:DMT family transporter [Aestuariivirga litoralis]MBG1233528.1 DMT family transporter [Aestuariivirga litoralis]
MTSASAKSLVVSSAPAVFVVLWATGFVVARLSAGHVAPVWFLALRFPLAGLFMLGLALVQRAAWPNARGVFHAFVAGALLHGLYLAPIYWAVANGLPAGVSALIVGLQPLLTSFLASWMLGEKLAPKHWLGLLVGLIGIVLVIAPKLQFAHLGGITPLTAGLSVFGACAISLGSVYQKKFASHIPLATGGVWQYVGASLVTLVISLLLGDFMFDHSVEAWTALAWAVLVLSVISILLLMMLINQGEVSRVSGLIFLVPAVSSLMTFVLFGETLTLVQLIGMAVCAGAVLIVNRA